MTPHQIALLLLTVLVLFWNGMRVNKMDTDSRWLFTICVFYVLLAWGIEIATHSVFAK